MKRFSIRPWETEIDGEPLEEDINALIDLDDMFSRVEEHKQKVARNKQKAKEIAKGYSK